MQSLSVKRIQSPSAFCHPRFRALAGPILSHCRTLMSTWWFRHSLGTWSGESELFTIRISNGNDSDLVFLKKAFKNKSMPFWLFFTGMITEISFVVLILGALRWLLLLGEKSCHVRNITIQIIMLTNVSYTLLLPESGLLLTLCMHNFIAFELIPIDTSVPTHLRNLGILSSCVSNRLLSCISLDHVHGR